MKIYNEPNYLPVEAIKNIEETKNARWVIDTEDPNNNFIRCSIFYSDEAHPDSNSHFFAIHVTNRITGQAVIYNGEWIKDVAYAGLIDENENVVFSKYNHDFVTLPNSDEFVDGGLAYTRTNCGDRAKYCSIKVSPEGTFMSE